MDAPRGRTVAAVELAGDLDAGTQADVFDRLHSALMSGAAHVVADMRGVTFLDSSGIQSLIRIALEARTIGSTFSIADASVRARRVLELSGLGDLLEPVSPEAPSS